MTSADSRPSVSSRPHRARNTIAGAASLAIGAAGLLGAKVDSWVCQTCGGPVRDIPRPPAPAQPATSAFGERVVVWGFVLLIGLVVLAGLLAVGDTLLR